MNIHETTKRRAIFRLCNRIAERTESNRAIWVTWGCELLGLPGDYSPDLVVKAHNEAVRVDNETGHAGATAKAIIGALTAPAPIIATRCTMHEAKRHFEAGGAVLVSEYGHEPTQTVTPITTTHDRTRTTWDDLATMVNEWRNRYPNQRFYIVPNVETEPYCNHDAAAVVDGLCECGERVGCTCSTDEDACPDHPGDPCPGCGRRSGHDDGCATVARLEYLRGELRGECISMGELHELQTLAPFIDPGDVELLEPAGVPEFPEDAPEEHRLTAATLALLVDALARDEDWSADTLDRLAEVLTVNGYAEARDGQFASTGRAEREAGIAPIR